jgi:hypothetical protein
VVAGHRLSAARCGLSGFRGAPRTRIRRTRTAMGSRPTRGRFDALQVVVLRTSGSAEAELGPSLRFRAPSETCHCSPAPQRRFTDPKVGRLAPRCSLSWAFVPYDTVSDRRTRLTGGGSLRHRVPRARFGYLLRDVHHRSYRRARRRSVPGLRPPRRSPRHERCPSRGPCPPDVAGRSPPRRENDESDRLQGLVPVPSPCCRRAPEGTRPSMPSWTSALQSVLPTCPGDRL